MRRAVSLIDDYIMAFLEHPEFPTDDFFTTAPERTGVPFDFEGFPF